jgi:dihydropteroate synthase
MTINCKGNLVDLSTPKVMGILNVTPDSFYDGGKYNSDKKLLLQTEKMLHEGASFIDVGAYSSKPNATQISEDEELKRLIPTLELLVDTFPDILISADTFRSTVARKSITSGASIINDISGGTLDTKMFKTVGELQVPYILMHIQGTPQDMQQNPTYDDVILSVAHYFSEKITALRKEKVNDIILDVGFGFGKTTEHNYTLLKNLSYFKSIGVPILCGLSRKSMLYKVLNSSSKEALNATTVGNTMALMNGTNILRVHDVKEAMEAVKIYEQIA